MKVDIGIPMLARTMSHWYRLDAVPLSRRWNSVVETTSTIRYRIDNFTSPNLSYAIFISLRYSGRHRIDIDLMQFCDGRNLMIWQVILIRIHNGIIKLGVTMQNTYIFCYFDVCHEFPISTEELNCKLVLIFSQMLWNLSIRLIERETDMRMYCSQWQLDDEL